MNIYCTYITFYRGNKLPPFYIGSSTVDRVKSGYRGSVRSIEYRKIWEREIRDNPHLFKTKITSTHNTRKLATEKELYFHNKLNVVISKLYVNKAKATLGGHFGMDVSGKNNPNYGKRWSKEMCDAASERFTEKHKSTDLIWISNITTKKTKHIDRSKVNMFLDIGWVEGRLFLKKDNQIKRGKILCEDRNNVYAHCIICHIQQQAHMINHHYEKHFTKGIEYFGERYTSFKELYEKTGCSNTLYNKYYKNGYDPRPMIGNKNIYAIAPKL